MALAQQFLGIGIRFSAKDAGLGTTLDRYAQKLAKIPIAGGGIRRAMNGFIDSFEKGGKAALRAGLSTAAFGDLALRGFTRAAAVVQGFAGDMISKAAEFEQEVTRIGIASGKSAGYIADLADQILRVSGPLPTTANELARATLAFAKMGFASTMSARSLAEMGRIAVMFGRAIGKSDEQSALFLGRLSTWVGIAEPTADQMERLGSAVARVGFYIKGNAEDVIKATERFGAFASSLGFSNAEVIALAGHVRDSGILIRRGSTAINRTLQQMVLRLDDFAQAMTEAKVVASPEEFKRMFRTAPMEAFQKVLQATEKQWGGNAAQMLRNLGIVGNYISDIITMSKNQGRLNTSLGLSREQMAKGAFLQEAYNKMANTFTQQLKAMTGAWDNLKITIGSKLLPVLTVLLETLTQVFNWFQGMHPVMKSLIGWMVIITAGLVMFGAVALPILFAVKLAGLGAAMSFGAMAIAMLKIVAIGLLVVAVLASIVALILYLAGVDDPFAKMGQELGNATAKLTNPMKQQLPGMDDAQMAALASMQRTGSIPAAPVPMAAGGRVDRPTLSLIGEGMEPEWVFPESKLAAVMQGAMSKAPAARTVVRDVTVPISVTLDGREIAGVVKTINMEDSLAMGGSVESEYHG